MSSSHRDLDLPGRPRLAGETAPPRPLLSGEDARNALAAAGEVRAALLAGPLERYFRSPSLASGSAGLAVALSQLPGSIPDTVDHPALATLDHAVDAVADRPLAPSLFAGVAGIAWANQFLAGDEEGDPNRDFDEALAAHLSESPWDGELDLVHGLTGFGAYALDRLPRPSAAAVLDRVLARLEDASRSTAEAPAWCPRGRTTDSLDLGLAHGLPGIAAVLARALAAGFEPPRTRRLLDQAVEAILASRLPTGSASVFPPSVPFRGKPRSSRLAWCRGDLSVALALLAAGTAAAEEGWRREALETALRAAERRPETSGVKDAGFCHGAAGVGHLFHRLHQASNDPVLAEASRCWFRRTLELRRPEQGIAGFPAWGPLPGGGEGWRDDAGILTGAAGVALALATAALGVETGWDGFLLTGAV